MQMKNSGMQAEAILKKMGLKTIPQYSEENYMELQNLWEREVKQTFRHVARWYNNNKGIEPTLEAMTKMVDFYHSKRVDMLKLGYTVLNFAKRFFHSSTDAALFPFCEKNKDYNKYIRKWLTARPSIRFTRYAKVGEERSESQKM